MVEKETQAYGVLYEDKKAVDAFKIKSEKKRMETIGSNFVPLLGNSAWEHRNDRVLFNPVSDLRTLLCCWKTRALAASIA
ncbi:MAG: hypothetical protein ACQ9MH_20325 [Nitrospinales bacterium]